MSDKKPVTSWKAKYDPSPMERIKNALQIENSEIKEELFSLKTENYNLKKALKEAEDALYFYSKKFNYKKDSMFDSEKGQVSQIEYDNGQTARRTLLSFEAKGFSKYGLLVYYKDGTEKILKYSDDDERDEDLRRLEFDKDVEFVCLYPIEEGE